MGANSHTPGSPTNSVSPEAISINALLQRGLLFLSISHQQNTINQVSLPLLGNAKRLGVRQTSGALAPDPITNRFPICVQLAKFADESGILFQGDTLIHFN